MGSMTIRILIFAFVLVFCSVFLSRRAGNWQVKAKEEAFKGGKSLTSSRPIWLRLPITPYIRLLECCIYLPLYRQGCFPGLRWKLHTCIEIPAGYPSHPYLAPSVWYPGWVELSFFVDYFFPAHIFYLTLGQNRIAFSSIPKPEPNPNFLFGFKTKAARGISSWLLLRGELRWVVHMRISYLVILNG